MLAPMRRQAHSFDHPDVRELRRRMGLTQRRFAERLLVTPLTVLHLLLVARPRYCTRPELANARLGCRGSAGGRGGALGVADVAAKVQSRRGR